MEVSLFDVCFFWYVILYGLEKRFYFREGIYIKKLYIDFDLRKWLNRNKEVKSVVRVKKVKFLDIIIFW